MPLTFSRSFFAAVIGLWAFGCATPALADAVVCRAEADFGPFFGHHAYQITLMPELTDNSDPNKWKNLSVTNTTTGKLQGPVANSRVVGQGMLEVKTTVTVAVLAKTNTPPVVEVRQHQFLLIQRPSKGGALIALYFDKDMDPVVLRADIWDGGDRTFSMYQSLWGASGFSVGKCD